LFRLQVERDRASGRMSRTLGTRPTQPATVVIDHRKRTWFCDFRD